MRLFRGGRRSGLSLLAEGGGAVVKTAHTWSKGRRDGRSPRIAVSHQLASSPDLSGEVDSRLVNLDKLEGVLVRIFAVSPTVGNVGQDGADVVRPLSPLKLDGSAGSDCRRDVRVDCILVAGNVGVSESC